MKQKTIGIFVCILLIAAAPTVASGKNVTIQSTTPTMTMGYMMINWTETQKLNASDGDIEDKFGWFVSISDDTALIGAPYDDEKGDNSGSAYVFIRNGTSWIQQAKLLAPDGADGDLFGRSVSLDGDTALIGACGDDLSKGSAYVFTRIGTIWALQDKIQYSGSHGGDWFGYYVSLDDDTALIGSVASDPNGVDSGSAQVFVRIGTNWTYEQNLFASDGAAYDAFGCSVSLDGDTAIIGAQNDGQGSAYVFNRSGTAWVQQAKLLASDGSTDDAFGCHVSISGNTALIGAYEDDDNGASSGSAYIFFRTGTNWDQQDKLLPEDGTIDDRFGSSVSLNGDTALIGAAQDEDNGVDSGSAYMFTRNGTHWIQQAKLLPSDGAPSDFFGCFVSLDDNVALIGAYNDNNKGSAYIFTNEPENQPPIAEFSYTPDHPITSEIIQFTDESSDPDGTIISWTWELGDGTNSTEQNPTHMYGTEGTYNITLSVVDDEGASATVSKQIMVISQQFKVALIFGRIMNVTTLTDITTFEAVKTRVITFSPINFNIYSSNENITIQKDKIGYIGQRFIFALCKTSFL